MRYVCSKCGTLVDDADVIFDGSDYYCGLDCFHEDYEEVEEAIPIEIQNGESALNPRGFRIKKKP